MRRSRAAATVHCGSAPREHGPLWSKMPPRPQFRRVLDAREMCGEGETGAVARGKWLSRSRTRRPGAPPIGRSEAGRTGRPGVRASVELFTASENHIRSRERCWKKGASMADAGLGVRTSFLARSIARRPWHWARDAVPCRTRAPRRAALPMRGADRKRDSGHWPVQQQRRVGHVLSEIVHEDQSVLLEHRIGVIEARCGSKSSRTPR